MSAPPVSRCRDDLAAVDLETARLYGHLLEHDDAWLAGPSRCAGWTRGHVVTHLARNADALRTLTRTALTGERLPMYASPEARDADIDAGSGRPLDVQVADFWAASDAWRRYAEALAVEEEWLGDVEVPARHGTVAALDIPFLRLREVVVHHLDLDSGFAYAALSPALQADLLAAEARRLGAAADGRPVRLVATEDDPVEAASPAPPAPPATSTGDRPVHTVRGTRAALLGWTTRGLTDGVTCDDGDLPTLPSGG